MPLPALAAVPGLLKGLGAASKLGGIFKGVGGALNIANSISGLFGANKMKKEAEAINPTWSYQKSNEADEMKGFAQMRLNSRNPMAELNRRSLLGGQANMIGAAQRNIIDPSQLLAMAAASEGQLGNSLVGLGQQDMAYEQMNVGNYMNALNTGVNQDNIENQFMANKFQMDQNRKDALMGASRQTSSNALANMSTGLMTMGDVAGKGGFTGLFGKKG